MKYIMITWADLEKLDILTPLLKHPQQYDPNVTERSVRLFFSGKTLYEALSVPRL